MAEGFLTRGFRQSSKSDRSSISCAVAPGAQFPQTPVARAPIRARGSFNKSPLTACITGTFDHLGTQAQRGPCCTSLEIQCNALLHAHEGSCRCGQAYNTMICVSDISLQKEATAPHSHKFLVKVAQVRPITSMASRTSSSGFASSSRTSVYPICSCQVLSL